MKVEEGDNNGNVVKSAHLLEVNFQDKSEIVT